MIQIVSRDKQLNLLVSSKIFAKCVLAWMKSINFVNNERKGPIIVPKHIQMCIYIFLAYILIAANIVCVLSDFQHEKEPDLSKAFKIINGHQKEANY